MECSFVVIIYYNRTADNPAKINRCAFDRNIVSSELFESAFEPEFEYAFKYAPPAKQGLDVFSCRLILFS